MMEKVVTILQEKDMIVSRFLFENYKQLGLQEDEFILLIYLLNEEDKIYDPTRISNKLNIPLPQVLNLTNSLIISYLEDEEFESNVCIMRGLDLLEEYLLPVKINSIQYDKETDWVKQYTDEEVMQRLKRLEKVINENIEKSTNNEKVKFFLMIMDNQICYNLLKVNEIKKEKCDECVEQL